MNTSNGYQYDYYQPKETKMYFWNCLNEKCSWSSEAEEDADDLSSIEVCPKCKCNTVSLESDFFQE